MPLVVSDDGTNGLMKLAEEAKRQLRGIGSVYYTEADNILKVKFPIPRTSRSVPFDLSEYGCAVVGMSESTKSKTGLVEGAVVLSVNGEQCRGVEDARRMLRDTCHNRSAGWF